MREIRVSVDVFFFRGAHELNSSSTMKLGFREALATGILSSQNRDFLVFNLIRVRNLVESCIHVLILSEQCVEILIFSVRKLFTFVHKVLSFSHVFIGCLMWMKIIWFLAQYVVSLKLYVTFMNNVCNKRYSQGRSLICVIKDEIVNLKKLFKQVKFWMIDDTRSESNY